ncbi:MAG: hypothetical protein RLZZ444_957 [Pseudomonadota bacterium]
MPAASPVQAAIEDIARHDWGRLLSGLVGSLGDFQLAEDSLQDALESALRHWSRNGLPVAPHAWLMKTAKRKAIDRLRRAANFQSKTTAIAHLIEIENSAPDWDDPDPIEDERLKLIFTCCHPAIDRKTAMALTLRSVCGLTTDEIADAFLDSADAMAQRLVRARHKIAKAGIAYAVPGPEGWADRLESVLGVIYLLFNEGYASSGENYIRGELCSEAIRLGKLLAVLCPDEAEVEGLLALMLLHEARRPARLSADGTFRSLEEQDRALWQHDRIAEAIRMLEQALRRGRAGTYQLQAAIIAIHAEAADFASTDWRQIVLIYDRLLELSPNPVFRLNRIVALSYAFGPQFVLEALDGLAEALADYQPYHAVRADLFGRAGHREEARAAYDQAIALSASQAEKAFLSRKRDALSAPGS